MGRIARVIAPGLPHHVTQRGNRRQPTFFCDEDYRHYLALLSEWCEARRVAIWAYCLMPNHVHLILVPHDADSLARAVGAVHRRDTRRVNFREDWRGHLWQGRFASFAMDEPHLLAATAYIERNPVKAGLVARAEDWPWSSAAAHCDRRRTDIAQREWLTDRIDGWICSWREYLAGDADPELIKQLRRSETTGRPMGDKPFLDRLSRQLRRNLIPQKRGPKRKNN